MVQIVSVLITANLHTGEKWDMTTLKGSALVVVKNSSSINTHQQNTVKLTGVKCVTTAGTENVYNMEVDDNHNFAISGGLIVHNCMDATRYFVHTMKIVRRGEKRIMRGDK